MTRPTFQGSIVALVTPFKNGKVDEAKLRELVDLHAAQGTDGIVPCGTTGESPTLSHDEHKRVVEVVIDAARGRLPIIAGTGSNATSPASTSRNAIADRLGPIQPLPPEDPKCRSNGTARLLQSATKDGRFEVTLVFSSWHLPETFQN